MKIDRVKSRSLQDDVGARVSRNLPHDRDLQKRLMAGLLISVCIITAAIGAASARGQNPLWSFQPIRRPEIPRSRYDSLSKNPIDRFLFARLEKEGLRPSPLADPRALIRRVTVDLTGLP